MSSQHELDMATKEKARGDLYAAAVSVMYGAKSMNQDEVSKLDERIAAKQAGAASSSGGSSSGGGADRFTTAAALVAAGGEISADDDYDDDDEEKKDGSGRSFTSGAPDSKEPAKTYTAPSDEVNTHNPFDDVFDESNEKGALLEKGGGTVSEEVADLSGKGKCPSVEYGEVNVYENDGMHGLVEAVQVEEEDDEEAFIPAAEEYDPDAKPPSLLYNPRFRIFTCLLLLVVVGVTVGLAVGLTQDMHTTENMVNKTEVPTLMPSAAPTSERDSMGIRPFLQNLYISPQGDDDSNNMSPQEMATDWIINQDAMQLTEESPNIVQRWALAVLAFATQHENWNVCGERPSQASGLSYKCHTQTLNQVSGEYEDNANYSFWMSPDNECAWYGVTCDPDTNATVKLELIENNLNGTFPAELTHLSDLRVLRLNANFFTGKLPPKISQFPTLNELFLHGNFLTGTIPEKLYDLNKLQQLSLGFNDLTGTISTKLGQLRNLKGLHLNDLLLYGTIPSEIGQLTFLSQLFTHNNAFTGTIPNEITQLTFLRQWTHFETLTTGTLPYDIGNLQDLEILYLNKNRLSGPLPPSFYNLSRLQQFRAWENRNLLQEPFSTGFNGTIASEIGNMKALVSFIAEKNSFEGELPVEFGSLTELEVVYFRFNDITGESPFCDADIPNLARQEYMSIEMDCLEENGVSEVNCQCCNVCCSDITDVCRDQG